MWCRGQAGVGKTEGGHAECEHPSGAGPVGVAPGRETGEGGGDVVRDVESEGGGRRRLSGTPRAEQLGRPQDQQRGRTVAELERGDASEQAAEWSDQDGPDPETQGPALPRSSAPVWRMA